MKISIITPIYNGNKYLNNYLKMIKQAISKISEIEVIWVNDSPNIPIEYDKNLTKDVNVQIIKNKENSGIHKSRVNGLKQAKGKYILFLDQDDEITEDALLSQYNKIQGHDLVIGNGYLKIKMEVIKFLKTSIHLSLRQRKSHTYW